MEILKSVLLAAALVGVSLLDNTFSEEELQKDITNYPLKRYGKPEEIAHAIIYLLSDASAWVTGTSLIIDGGVSLK